jgi:hypothetical protein
MFLHRSAEPVLFGWSVLLFQFIFKTGDAGSVPPPLPWDELLDAKRRKVGVGSSAPGCAV